MSVLTFPEVETLTHESLEEYYKVTDLVVQEQVDYLDFQLRDDQFVKRSVCCFTFLEAGTERSAYYDPSTNLVYKRRHQIPLVDSREFARLERIALYKAHLWLNALGKGVRYADTWFHVAPSGVEYMVQEYIPNVGSHRLRDVLTDEIADILERSMCAETGLSKDYTDGNVGFDPVVEGMAVLIDLLEIRPNAWW